MRIVSAIILMCGALCPSRAAQAPAADSVTPQDARLALQIASGLDVSSPSETASRSRLTLLDAVRLLRIANGTDPMPPGGTALVGMWNADRLTLDHDVEHNFVLARGFRLTGHVVDENGRPIKSSVRLESGSRIEACSTGVDGAFSMTTPGDDYSVWIIRDESSTDPQSGEKTRITTWASPVESIAVSKDSSVTFACPPMPPLGTITGHITGGKVVPSFISAAIDLPGGGRCFAESNVRDGRYTMACPAAEIQSIGVSGFLTEGPRKNGLNFDVPGLAVHAGETVEHDIVLPDHDERQRLLVTVIPPPGLHVWGVDMWTAHTDRGERKRYSDGMSFTEDVDGPVTATLFLPPDEYEVSATLLPASGRDGLTRSYRQLITLSAGNGAVTLRPTAVPRLHTIRGRVADAAGRPVPGANVAIVWDDYMSTSPRYFCDAYTTAGPDGAYSVRVPDGSYALRASPQGHPAN